MPTSKLNSNYHYLPALSSAEKKKKPSISSMFDDVYDKRTPDLERQHKELLDHLEEYGEHYDLSVYSK